MEEAMFIVDFQNSFIFILLCLCTLLCYSLFFRKPRESRLEFDLPPSPPSLPIIGHVHHLLSPLVHKSLQKLSSKYGSILHLRILGFPVVIVSSASVAYEIFRAHDLNISSRGFSPTHDSIFAGSFSFISAPYGDYWKFMKKILVTNLLGPQALERSRIVRADELDRFYKNLFDKAMKKKDVEICEEALKLSNNSFCKMITGKSCSEEAEIVMGLASELDVLTKKILLANMLPEWFKKLVMSLFKKEMMALSDKFDELFERILEKRDGHQETSLMDSLLAASRDENADCKITRNHIKSFLAVNVPPSRWLYIQNQNCSAYEYVLQLQDLLFSGTNTSVQTTQWIMAEIIKNPSILERLREELDLVVGKTRLIQDSDLPNLSYLQAVVTEGLRLHPPGPLFARFSQEGCRIRGFYVPEKTVLMVNAYAVMRDQDYWEDPDEFKPERFLLASSRTGEEEVRREQAIKYIPFGSGRRSCPGENLAYVFIGTAIGVMLQGFDWRIKEEKKVNMEETVVGLTLTMAHPLKLTPVARTLSPLTLNLKSQGS